MVLLAGKQSDMVPPIPVNIYRTAPAEYALQRYYNS